MGLFSITGKKQKSETFSLFYNQKFQIIKASTLLGKYWENGTVPETQKATLRAPNVFFLSETFFQKRKGFFLKSKLFEKKVEEKNQL